jgi:hypothetical protein
MTLDGGGQKQIERPQDRKPRPTGQGPSMDVDIDIGDTDELLKELDIIEHPERYSQDQRDCGCLRPSRGGLR